MPRALVTGGAGFLGSHLCDRLLAEGFEVTAMDNLITGNVANLRKALNSQKFRFVQYDVTNYLFLDGPVDYIFHAASPASPVDYLNHPIHTMKVGSLGTHKVLGLARAKGARFLMFSTSEIYGDPSISPQPEEYWGNVNTLGTRGVYDEAKRFSEAMTMAYRRAHGVNTAIVRIFNTYGPRMRLADGRVVPNFIAQALRNEPLTVYGGGQQTRSFCYVSDLIEGIFRLATSDQPGPINIGNPQETTILEFAQRIKELTQSASEIVFEPLPTEDDPKQRCPDLTKARACLGYEPVVSLDEGLRRTIEYFRPLIV
ncbi:MAG TPA: UDP-glucuronic acid decarboxylase family protein [Armatimonadota bacterium]